MSDVRERAIEVMAIADWYYDDGDLPTWGELPEMAPGQQERSRERFTEICTALRQAGIVLVDAAEYRDLVTLYASHFPTSPYTFAALDQDATGTPGEGT